MLCILHILSQWCMLIIIVALCRVVRGISWSKKYLFSILYDWYDWTTLFSLLQVAVLAPTRILATQHVENFRERMPGIK